MWDTKFGFPPEPPSSPAGVAAPSPKRRREEGVAEMREEAVERLRGVVRDNVGKHLYASAIFLADKVATATGDPTDVYMLAQALFLDRHFRRALHLLNSSPLLRDLRFRFLAASSPPLGCRLRHSIALHSVAAMAGNRTMASDAASESGVWSAELCRL